MISPFDVFRVDTEGSFVWRCAADTLEEAKLRIREFSATLPGNYIIANILTGQKVKVSPDDTHEPV
jgi:hypothetical protein